MNRDITVLEPEKKKKMKRVTKIFIVCTTLLAFMLTSVFGVSIYVGYKLTTPARQPLLKTPKDFSMEYEDISFYSRTDKIKLSGWWMDSTKNRKNVTVIFSHGYGNNRAMTAINGLALAKELTENGYDVLTFDYRASGISEGKRCTDGVYEQYDLLGAVDYAITTKNAQDIHIIGWSMGAAVAINAAVQTDKVSAVVADSPYANLKTYLQKNMHYKSRLPDFPFTSIILAVLPAIFNLNPEEVDSAKAASHFENRALLLIHSKDDTSVPVENSETIWGELKENTKNEIWLTTKSKHIRSYKDYPSEYTIKVLEFFGKN